jgi:hypothetical protein
LLSPLASAAGNPIQAKLYRKWPHDSTNLRLHPSDNSASKRQKKRWYEAVQRLTGLDIAAVAEDLEEATRVNNYSVVTLRTKGFEGNTLAERLDIHNADYVMTRNHAGLRPVWLLTSFASCVDCWVVLRRSGGIPRPSGCRHGAVRRVHPRGADHRGLRHTARHYADSFFGALDACDEACQAKTKKKGGPGTVASAPEPPEVPI